MPEKRQISRRQLLISGAGLAAAAVVGCGDENDGAGGQTPTANPLPSRTPGVITTSPEPTLASPRWGRLPQGSITPPARRDHSLVTDGQRLYVFGGHSSDTLGDFWVYNLTSSQWSEVTAPGPSARFGHNAGYLAIAGRVIVFGGQADGFFNDIWAYTPTSGTWQQAPSTGGPSPRYGAAGVASGEPMIISHGFTDTGRFDDTWAYGAGTWGDLSPASGPRPIERCLTRAVFDQVTGTFILFGGQTDSAPYLGDTWQLTIGVPPADQAWTEVKSDRKPSPRNLFSMVWDDERRRALVFGGQTEDGRTNDVWIFDALSKTWAELPTQGEAPSARSGHDAVWLPGRRAMLVFGGQDADGDQNDLWELAFHG